MKLLVTHKVDKPQVFVTVTLRVVPVLDQVMPVQFLPIEEVVSTDRATVVLPLGQFRQRQG